MTQELNRFCTIEPGHPLGVGMPTGNTLRVDGESHREAWWRILRSDPCAYCGRMPWPISEPPYISGTIDHIVPRDPLVILRGIGDKHDWLNVTAACPSCNMSKSNKPMLRFLRTRTSRKR